MATAGMSARERAAWFRCHRIPAESHDPTCPSRFICDGAPPHNRRLSAIPRADGTLKDIAIGDYYHQAEEHGRGRNE